MTDGEGPRNDISPMGVPDEAALGEPRDAHLEKPIGQDMPFIYSGNKVSFRYSGNSPESNVFLDQ